MVYKEEYHDPEWLQDIVKEYLKPKSLNLCCGMSKLGDIRVDIDPSVNPDIVADIWDLPFEREEFDSIYCDPVWESQEFWIGYKGIKQKYNLMMILRNLLKPNGILIWNCMWAYSYIKGFKTIDAKYHHSRISGIITATMIYKKVNSQLSGYGLEISNDKKFKVKRKQIKLR